jgi:hypothetical protein
VVKRVKVPCEQLLSRCAYQTVILSGFNLVVMLNDLAEMDALLFELGDLSGKRAENAAEKLMQRCSHSGEAFQYLQDRMYDTPGTGAEPRLSYSREDPDVDES